MRRRSILVIAGVLCVSPLLGELVLAQAPAAPAAPAVSPLSFSDDNRKIGRAALGEWQDAARRRTNGKVGLWTPKFGVTDPILEFHKSRFSRGRRLCTWLVKPTNWSRIHGVNPSGVARQFLTPYGVEFVEMPESAALHLRRRRAAHVPYRSTWMAARIRRISCPATTAIPSAGGKATRSSSTRSDSTSDSGSIGGASSHGSDAHHRAVYPHRSLGHERSRPSTIREPTRRPGPVGST